MAVSLLSNALPDRRHRTSQTPAPLTLTVRGRVELLWLWVVLCYASFPVPLIDTTRTVRGRPGRAPGPDAPPGTRGADVSGGVWARVLRAWRTTNGMRVYAAGRSAVQVRTDRLATPAIAPHEMDCCVMVTSTMVPKS